MPSRISPTKGRRGKGGNASEGPRVPIDCFASFLLVMRETYSSSVQRALFQMGEAAPETFSDLSRIRLSLSSKHYLGSMPPGWVGPPTGRGSFCQPTIRLVAWRQWWPEMRRARASRPVARRFGRLTSIPPMRRLPAKSTMAAEPCARLQ